MSAPEEDIGDWEGRRRLQLGKVEVSKNYQDTYYSYKPHVYLKVEGSKTNLKCFECFEDFGVPCVACLLKRISKLERKVEELQNSPPSSK